MAAKVEEVQQELRKVEEKIDAVGKDLRKVEEKIDVVEKELEAAAPQDVEKKRRLRDKGRRLGDKERRLGELEIKLWEGKIKLEERYNFFLTKVETSEQHSKRLKTAPTAIQVFVQSAAESYRKWERDYQLALRKVGEDPEKMRRPFLELKNDPLYNFHYGFLLWVRECYTDMKDIMSAAEPGQRFTILGTSGIGKSLFTIFWICYWATLKGKVVWKQGEQALYLLDFSAEPLVKDYDPQTLHHADIKEVLHDENAWLVIDGGQAENLPYACKILQACSMRKENYKEYAKSHLVTLQYFPVWEEEEICQFLDEFEQHRLKYEHMLVPLRDDALCYFQKIGGVARYVLCGSNTESRLKDGGSALVF